MTTLGKNLKIVDADKINIWIAVILGIVAIIVLGTAGATLAIKLGQESYWWTSVGFIMAILNHFWKGPGVSNVAKTLLTGETLEEKINNHDALIKYLSDSREKISPPPSLQTSKE